MLAKNKLCQFSDEDEALINIIREKHKESKSEIQAIRHGLAYFAGNLLKKEYETSVLKGEMSFDEYVNHVIYKYQKKI